MSKLEDNTDNMYNVKACMNDRDNKGLHESYRVVRVFLVGEHLFVVVVVHVVVR